MSSPRRVAVVTCALLAAGCLPELGECDPAAARRIVYDATGAPAYEGQALVIGSCASGGVCHGAVVEGALDGRLGAPAGLMFDVQLSSFDESVDDDEIVRQRRGRFRILQEGRNALDAVHRRTMPPPAPASDLFFALSPSYANVDGPLPPAGSDEGEEILRNWLACGAPVVERTVPRPDGQPSAVAERLDVPPLEPTDDSIYGDLLAVRCNAALCHGGNEDAGFQVTTDQAATLAAITGNTAPRGDSCTDAPSPLITPGAPDQSLFYLKLALPSADVCGSRMPQASVPLSDGDLAVVREWIEAMAP